MQFPFSYNGTAGEDIDDVHDAKSGWYRLQSWTACNNKAEGSGVILCWEIGATRKMILTISTFGKIFLSVLWDGIWEKDNMQLI